MAIKINGDNSVANPGFTGDDTDTGLQVGTDELKLVTGGTARATVDSSGNTTFTGVVQSGGNPNDGGAVGTKMTSTGVIQATRSSGASAVFTGYTQGTTTPTIRINGDGSGYFSANLGIGTTSPNSYSNYNVLTLNGTTGGVVDFESNGTLMGQIYCDTTDFRIDARGSTTPLKFVVNSAERMRIKSDGTLHVIKSGTQITNAEQTVAVFQRSSSTGSTARISIVSGNAASSQIQFGDTDDEDVGIIHYDHADNSMRFSTNTSERMRIDSSGQLLMGSSSSTFNVIANQNNAGALHFSGGGSGSANIQIHGSSHSSDAKVITMDTNSVERFRITSTGKVRAPQVYSQTTTTGGAVYVQSDGDLLRYTSSLKYKTDVETIEDARADAILSCRPVWYRSICESDITTEGSEKSDWGWYGFIAEEVAEVEPRLVNWATKDAVEQEDGSMESVQRDPANYTAEGVRYENFIPLLVNLVKRQQVAIETLETQNADLTARITALETA